MKNKKNTVSIMSSASSNKNKAATTNFGNNYVRCNNLLELFFTQKSKEDPVILYNDSILIDKDEKIIMF